MPVAAAASRLETHEVADPPPPREGLNLYACDLALGEAVRREGGDWVDARAQALGAAVGSAEVLRWGVEANRHPPELAAFDRYGRRLDEVRFHPAWHALMGLAMDHEIHDVAWTCNRPGGHVAHAALLSVFTQAEAGAMCPINMTYASVPALRSTPAVAAPWLERLLGGRYDAPLAPIAQKRGITLGMAMTEKQGGSDVRANTTRAESTGDGDWRLTGHKWFCSAPMSDGFLTLAYAPGGLSCFLVPRVTPDGERNAIRLMRLKDKLGNRSNASAEIEYAGAVAHLLGEEGSGVRVIIDMVHHTRLGTIAGTLGIMRAALAEATWWCAHRTAFQKRLIDQPAMAGVLADLALDYEAAAALVMHVAAAFDAQDEDGRAYARLAVAVAKFQLTKRCPQFVYECMEAHGGVGYCEDTPMPRLFRESPLNAIWEGSGNVIALDILRTLRKAPAGLDALLAHADAVRGADRRLDRARDAAQALARDPALGEAGARRLAEALALVLQGALLVRHAPAAVSDGFIAARLGEDGGSTYGASAGWDVAAVLARQRS